MFSDPFTSVMVLIILSFIGVIVMFFFGLRGLGVLQKELRDRQMELENALLELEQRLTARIAESSRFSRDAPRGDASGREEPGNLLENASWRESGGAAWSAAGSGNDPGVSHPEMQLPPLVDESPLPFPKGLPKLSLARGKREPFTQGPDGLTLK